MLILLTYKEPKNTFFDTVLWVKIFVEGRGGEGPGREGYISVIM